MILLCVFDKYKGMWSPVMLASSPFSSCFECTCTILGRFEDIGESQPVKHFLLKIHAEPT